MNASNTTAPDVASNIPAYAGDEVLVERWRGEFVESVHRGSIAMVDATGAVVAGVGNTLQPVFLRSGAKPFQVMPALMSGGVERFGITQPELAVMCSSHTGEQRHVQAVQSVLGKIGLDEGALRCGIHAPLSVEAAAERWRRGLEPTAACNNCSGAHAGMLVACQAEGWSIQEYGNPAHPLQRRIREVISQFAGLASAELAEATDTCSVPTFRLSLYCAALMFARLASGRGVSEPLAHAADAVRRAMTAHPEMVGGENRLDSDLMRAAGGNLVSKGGAEGFQGVGVLRTGVGLALKISDGDEVAARAATVQALDDVGVLSPDALSALDEYRAPKVMTLRGGIAGRTVPTFRLRELR